MANVVRRHGGIWPDAETSLVGLIGASPGKSLSPAIHNAAFAHSGLNWTYVAFAVPSGSGEAAARAMRPLGIAGMSVTIPHKVDVIRAVDAVSIEAEAIGAVNTLYWDSDDLAGGNTDAAGFSADMKAEFGGSFRGASAVILGAGGAARAIAYALADGGAAEVAIAARSVDRASNVARVLGLVSTDRPTSGMAVGFGTVEFVRVLERAQIVVNATPVGSEGESPLIDVSVLRSDAFVYDLIYRETALVAAARAAGLQSATGLGMLVEQAALQFEIWTDETAPREVMADAARSAMAESGQPE